MKDKCIYSKYCGGCTLQGITYTKQLQIKQDYIDNLLKRFGKVEPILGMDGPYNYRNKMQVSLGYDEHHHVICGDYVPSTHMIVPIEDCMITDEKANKIINSIVRLIKKYKISIFDERAYKGCLRHILIRTSNTNEIMVVLVTGSFNIVKKDLFIKDILKFNPEITTIIQNFNNKRTSMILGDKSTTLYGKGYIYDELCGYKFKISPSSFYQVNKRQTEILYNTGLKLANFSKEDTIIDAYSGIGTIGIIASKDVKRVLSVELNKEATKDGLKNAKLNNINNIEFINSDAGKFMENMAKNKLKLDGLIMDPPRAGADKKFLNAIYKLKPRKILYISCGPETLKSNLIDLTKNGYKVEKIQPVDMFPFTNHVETCVLLVREFDDKDKSVSIKVDLDGISFNRGEYLAPEKATYDNIKQYIKDKYDLNVSTLYIAQTKDKLDLEKRDNYNFGQGKSKQRHCPKEKEDAIKDAFRHFGLI